ncbi:MAG: nucleoside transporter C-terminal domain-containing protein [Planctomycetaceae bacterium]
MGRYQGLIGVVVLLGIAWLLSNNRQRINLRIVAWGLGLQIVFALLILRSPLGYPAFDLMDRGVARLLSFSDQGAQFLFRPLNPQYVVDYDKLPPEGDVAAGSQSDPPPERLRLRAVKSDAIAPMVQTLAFAVLPTVIFFAALMSVLYHLGVMQVVVRSLAWVMCKTMGTSGAETLSVAADIFVGQTEAPLFVRPFLAGMTRSELMTVMCGGFATIAGGVMAIYVGVLHEYLPNIAGHLMAASVMGAPAAIVIAKIMHPETETSQTAGGAAIQMERRSRNLLEAVGNGATDGLKLALNIAAMLIAIVALVALVNFLLSLVGTSLQAILAVGFRPIAWCIGVPWDEAGAVGTLLGEKIVLTELIAYLNLSELMSKHALSERSAVIASYALCGFANFASIGVQIGGIDALAPERKGDASEIALRAMIGGALATCLIGAIAGIVMK